MIMAIPDEASALVNEWLRPKPGGPWMEQQPTLATALADQLGRGSMEGHVVPGWTGKGRNPSIRSKAWG